MNAERVSLIVAKNRNGETGTVALGWEPKCMRFREAWEVQAA